MAFVPLHTLYLYLDCSSSKALLKRWIVLTSSRVLYWVNDINQQPGGRFVFANGDPTGYGFHADFVNGWDQDVLSSAVGNCLYTDNGGVVTACQPLVPTNDVNFSRDCLQAKSTITEQVYGNLTTLPGCNPVTFEESEEPTSCASETPSIIASSAASSVTSISYSTTSHPPLLTTASLPLVVSTLTTFVTVTIPASNLPTTTSQATVSPPSTSTPTTTFSRSQRSQFSRSISV